MCLPQAWKVPSSNVSSHITNTLAGEGCAEACITLIQLPQCKSIL